MQQWHYWYLLSVLLFFLEATHVPGIGLFFAAFGSLSVGLLLQGGWLGDGWLIQATVFFFLTGLWTAALWVPLKKLRLRFGAKTQTHHDVIGRSATVVGAGLVKGAAGQAQWSGTAMTARLADDATLTSAPAGTELKIVDIKGLTLILAENTYPIGDSAD